MEAVYSHVDESVSDCSHFDESVSDYSHDNTRVADALFESIFMQRDTAASVQTWQSDDVILCDLHALIILLNVCVQRSLAVVRWLGCDREAVGGEGRDCGGQTSSRVLRPREQCTGRS